MSAVNPTSYDLGVQAGHILGRVIDRNDGADDNKGGDIDGEIPAITQQVAEMAVASDTPDRVLVEFKAGYDHARGDDIDWIGRYTVFVRLALDLATIAHVCWLAGRPRPAATGNRPVLTLHLGDGPPGHPTEAARRALLTAADVETPEWSERLRRLAAALPRRD